MNKRTFNTTIDGTEVTVTANVIIEHATYWHPGEEISEILSVTADGVELELTEAQLETLEAEALQLAYDDFENYQEKLYAKIYG